MWVVAFTVRCYHVAFFTLKLNIQFESRWNIKLSTFQFSTWKLVILVKTRIKFSVLKMIQTVWSGRGDPKCRDVKADWVELKVNPLLTGFKFYKWQNIKSNKEILKTTNIWNIKQETTQGQVGAATLTKDKGRQWLYIHWRAIRETARETETAELNHSRWDQGRKTSNKAQRTLRFKIKQEVW